jgi:hypothetical protein
MLWKSLNWINDNVLWIGSSNKIYPDGQVLYYSCIPNISLISFTYNDQRSIVISFSVSQSDSNKRCPLYTFQMGVDNFYEFHVWADQMQKLGVNF